MQKLFQNVLFHAPDCSHQERTRTNRYPRHTHSLLRSLSRASISDDHRNENLKVLTTQVRSTGDLRMAKVSLLPT